MTEQRGSRLTDRPVADDRDVVVELGRRHLLIEHAASSPGSRLERTLQRFFWNVYYKLVASCHGDQN